LDAWPASALESARPFGLPFRRTMAAVLPLSVPTCFDGTPARRVTGLITECGTCEANETAIRALFAKESSRRRPLACPRWVHPGSGTPHCRQRQRSRMAKPHRRACRRQDQRRALPSKVTHARPWRDSCRSEATSTRRDAGERWVHRRVHGCSPRARPSPWLHPLLFGFVFALRLCCALFLDPLGQPHLHD